MNEVAEFRVAQYAAAVKATRRSFLAFAWSALVGQVFGITASFFFSGDGWWFALMLLGNCGVGIATAQIICIRSSNVIAARRRAYEAIDHHLAGIIAEINSPLSSDSDIDRLRAEGLEICDAATEARDS